MRMSRLRKCQHLLPGLEIPALAFLPQNVPPHTLSHLVREHLPTYSSRTRRWRWKWKIVRILGRDRDVRRLSSEREELAL